ncbi:helix-turn-helix transcriptional regulator [Streptomyces brasiliensis]|uniref:Transcriptional regulator n=1 Tax=Streptomyces brasiliensis TaxID=1954 RepID=A0A917UI77_9ACTN|nr:helix-turn-helix transcriptional regulator [Streptomyces brasiliensis]GGJ60377.1 transcriptional regulator [Streptomyces brasiliensis]
MHVINAVEERGGERGRRALPAWAGRLRGSLQALGLSATAEAAYLLLVEHGPQALAGLTARMAPTGLPLDGLRDAVAELGGLGLVSATGGRLSAQPPRAVLESVAERCARQARIAHESATALSRYWLDHTAGASYVEVVDTSERREAVQARVHEEAVAQVRALCIGPVGGGDQELKVGPGTLDALDRGISYRVVYGADILRDPKALDLAYQCVDRGEQARVCPDVALNVLVCDERFAVVFVAAPDRRGHHSVVVQPSGLLDGLVGVFESYWRTAVPLPSSGEAVTSEASAQGRQLLAYLSAGLTDQSIARELGVSMRTVARRIARLQEMLGAKTRFQLGVQAGRRGWL